jgi:hypothetical protein
MFGQLLGMLGGMAGNQQGGVQKSMLDKKRQYFQQLLSGMGMDMPYRQNPSQMTGEQGGGLGDAMNIMSLLGGRGGGNDMNGGGMDNNMNNQMYRDMPYYRRMA